MKTDHAPARIQRNFRCFAGLLLTCFPAIVNAAEPRPETLQAWDRYIQRAELRTNTSAAGNSPFLWSDQDPLRAERMRRGEVLVAPGTGANCFEAVPRGLIYHWIGAVFIPGVTVAQVFAVVEDYGHYAEFYRPAVIDAALLGGSGKGRNGEEEQFRVRYAQKVLFTSEVLEGEFQKRYTQREERQWRSISQSTLLQEIRDHGNSRHQGDTHDDGDPYIWRIQCITRYEQKDGGVYIEQENVVLSRSIPISLRWLVEPAVRAVSRELAAASLRQMREAVLATTYSPGPSGNIAARTGG
jgi:hypothetical protein